MPKRCTGTSCAETAPILKSGQSRTAWPSRLAVVGHAFWTWLVPAAGVLLGAIVLFVVLPLFCFLL